MQSLGSIRNPLSPHRDAHNILAVKQGSTVPSIPGVVGTSVTGLGVVGRKEVVVVGGGEVVVSAVTRNEGW